MLSPRGRSPAGYGAAWVRPAAYAALGSALLVSSVVSIALFGAVFIGVATTLASCALLGYAWHEHTERRAHQNGHETFKPMGAPVAAAIVLGHPAKGVAAADDESDAPPVSTPDIPDVAIIVDLDLPVPVPNLPVQIRMEPFGECPLPNVPRDVKKQTRHALGLAHRGFLLKRSGTKGTRFQRRFFIAHGRYLSYFKEATDSIPAGCIDLSQATAHVPDESTRLRPFEFVVVVHNGKAYHLVGNDAGDTQRWTTVISSGIAAYAGRALPADQPPPPHPTSSLAADVERCQHRGALMKTGGNHQTWHKRYGVLLSDNLSYFKKEPSKRTATGKRRGAIPLVGAYLLETVAADRPHAFAIMTRDRQYLMVAPSDKERAAWCQAILRVLGELRATVGDGRAGRN